MRSVFVFLVLVCLASFYYVEAQRRSGPNESETPRGASRGRARFTVDQSVLEDQKQQLSESRRPSSRKTKPQSSSQSIVSQPLARTNYEVQEEFEDTPIENYRSFGGRPRVFTESKFEAPNAPPTNLFQPSTTESLDDVIRSIGSDLLDGTTTPLASSSTVPTVEVSSEAELSSTEASKIDNQITTARNGRRSNGRPKNVEATTSGRVRTRSRVSGFTPKVEEASTTSKPARNFRRRPSASTVESNNEEASETRTRSKPSVETRGRLNKQENTESRSGNLESRTNQRTIDSRSRQEAAKSTIEPRTRTLEDAAARSTLQEVVRTTPHPRFRTRGSPTPVLSTLESGELPTRSRTGRKIAPTKEPSSVVSDSPKPRSSSRRRPQQQPEVTTARSRTRSRLPPVIDEQKLEVLPLFEEDPKIVRTNKLRRPNSAEEVSNGSASVKHNKFEPRVKESVVISEVTEVTSRRTVPKRKYSPKSRPHSAENIDDSDNYPEHFKALLKKKYNNNESRSSATVPQHRNEKVVTSAISTAPPKYDNENEVEPSKHLPTSTTLRPTRKRFSPHPRTTGTTTTNAPTTAGQKYHAKFHPKRTDHETTSHKPAHFSPKPPRGLYSSRKIKETSVSKDEVNKIASNPKKANRYSSRYRYNSSTRSSTSAPAYLPTIPPVVPNSVTEDKDLGVEVITFDDPVVTLPSANLVNGDYAVKPLVSESQVRTSEKPVSIIERIINSISAISTEEPLSSTSTPATTTKPSAILKLASKKPSSSLLNSVTPVPTTEKPTTIIQRILSSLSAINSTTEQVGNFNTIYAASSTTPMPKVARSTLPAQLFSTSTTLSPVNVLNDIANEQTLQKRTIGKLLELLNHLVTTTSTPEVIVTPKPSTVLYTSPAAIPSSRSFASSTTEPTIPTTGSFTTFETVTPNDVTTEFGTTVKVDPVPLSVGVESTTPSVTTESETETVFTVPSTIPNLPNFEVSPGSVSIFSANDLSNFITPDDFLSTVTISGRTNFPETVGTTVESTTNDLTTTFAPIVTSTVANPTTLSNSVDATGSTAMNQTDQTVSTSSTASSANSTSPPNRSGRLLNVVQEPVSNSLENSTASTTQDPDYFIFAVLNNNTILRKRPSRYPKNTPFLIVGLYPNNTVVRKFPNGTIVPMEPIVRVSGFDTRANPPPLPEITSNQVTPDQGRRPDNQTVDQNTIPTSVDANPLSISSTTSTSSSTSTSTTTVPSTSTVTLPSLTEILNGRTIKAFNSIINISDLGKTTTTTASTSTPVVTTLPPPTLSNRILSDSMTVSTMQSTFTTDRQEVSNTIAPSTTVPNTTPKITTALPLTQPSTTNYPTTTLFPSFITTLLSTLQPRRYTTTPFIVTPEVTTVFPSVTTTKTPTTTAATTRFTTTPTATNVVPLNIRSVSGDLIGSSSTTRPVTTVAPVTTTRTTRTTTRTTPTTTRTTTTRTTTARSTTTTTRPTTTTHQTVPTLNTKKPLTEQQKKDLETIAQLEREQEQILKQLSFLTNLNIANNKPSTTNKNSLANRIIAMAVERDKTKSGFEREPKTISETTLNYEEFVKQITASTSSSVTNEYGSHNDALLASLLKEQGIGPTTPRSLSDVYTPRTTTTKRPRTTTPPPPGPLMRSLSWLLNALAPPTTRRPKPKPKPTPKPAPKPEPKPKEEELLSNQPTHITPVVTAPPRQNLADSLTQEEIQKLIRQLEGVQKDPSKAKTLDLSSVKSLQSLINSDDSNGKPRVAKSTTALPVIKIIGNSIAEEEEFTTTPKPRVVLPPVKLKPVPGVEEGETRIRGQLISAAVNVTRAISSFLGSALQDAAQHLSGLITRGSSNLRDYYSSSSLANPSRVPSA